MLQRNVCHMMYEYGKKSDHQYLNADHLQRLKSNVYTQLKPMVSIKKKIWATSVTNFRAFIYIG